MKSYTKYIFVGLREYRFRTYMFFLISLILTAASVTIPMITRRLINVGIAEGSSEAIIMSAIGLGMIGITNQLLSLLSRSYEITVSQGIVKKLREKLTVDLSWLSSKNQSDKGSGYMISRIQSDAQNIGGFIRSIATLGTQFFLMAVSIVITWTLLKGAVIILMPIVFITFIIGMYAYRAIHSRSMISLENGAIVFGSVGELIEGRETLTTQGGSKRVTANVIQKQTDHIGSIKRLLLTQTKLRTVTGIIRTIGLSVLLGWSGFRVSLGEITFGDWYAINLYAGLVLGAAVSIANTVQSLGQTMAAAERIMEIKSQAEEEKSRFDKYSEKQSDGSVLVRDLTFSYDNNPPVISALDLVIEAHTLALISGPSGAGKTTLCKLLSGQLDPDAGEVLVGGRPPLPVGHASENGTVAVLPQEVFIFNASIQDNISLGNEEASLEEIKKAAALAGIHDEIMAMESGYDTVPGPRGNKLSLGQKRRIALSRSLLSHPDLIILDEPFASLDRENVLNLARTLRECAKRCTVIVVSHGWEEELGSDVVYTIENI